MDHPFTTRKPATYADLAALPPNVKGEILDGVLYTQPRPMLDHSDLQSEIHGELWAHYDRGRRGRPNRWLIIQEPGIQLPRSPEFSPDVAGWLRSRLPERPIRPEPIGIVPDWICEVLSPSNRKYDTHTKRRFYLEIGVPYLWYVDPVERTLLVTRLYEGRWLELGSYSDGDVVRAEPFEEIEIDLSIWWECMPLLGD